MSENRNKMDGKNAVRELQPPQNWDGQTDIALNIGQDLLTNHSTKSNIPIHDLMPTSPATSHTTDG